MARGKEYFINTTKNYDTIYSFFNEMHIDGLTRYLSLNNQSEFVLAYKYITHSDIVTTGKATRANNLQKNILYYFSVEDMKNGDMFTKVAHQSSISFADSFYKDCNFPTPRNGGKGHKFNEWCTGGVFLVNYDLDLFSTEYTKTVLTNLGKKASWDYDSLIPSFIGTKDDFIPIDISCSVHGLGKKNDKDFHRVRHNIFKGDKFILLYDKSAKKLFITLQKNPRFYEVLSLPCPSTAEKKYIIANDKKVMRKVAQRNGQANWRSDLAEEAMAYTNDGNRVQCPFTHITADIDKLSPLFFASHIYEYSASNDLEKYALANGLLLSKNADALFDAHLITIGEDKKFIFSEYLKQDPKLIKELKLEKPIAAFLTKERMCFMEKHRQIFFELEEKKKWKKDLIILEFLERILLAIRAN